MDPGACRHRTAPIVDDTMRHATATSIFDEAGLTALMTAPPPHLEVANGNGVGKFAAGGDKTPMLAHRMKHDKSILALVVSAEYIWAGTQGGEILVCGLGAAVYSSSANRTRSTASTRTIAGESSRRTKAACWDSVCRKIRGCCCPARQTQSST